MTTLSDNAAINSEAVRFADAHHGWVSGQGLLTTLDGGQTWKGAGLKGFVGPAAPAGDSVWALQTPCGDSAGSCSPVLVQSHVGSATWEPAPQQPGLPAGSADLLRVSASEAFITDIPRQQLADPVLLKTINAGSTWQQLKNPCGPTTSESLASLDGVHAWIACGYGPSAGNEGKSVFVSDDGGATWHVEAETGVPGSGAPTPTGSLGTAGYVSTHGWLTSGAGGYAYGWPGLFLTTDGGLTWSQIAASR